VVFVLSAAMVETVVMERTKMVQKYVRGNRDGAQACQRLSSVSETRTI
jgi:hypothetical protein